MNLATWEAICMAAVESSSDNEHCILANLERHHPERRWLLKEIREVTNHPKFEKYRDKIHAQFERDRIGDV